MAITEKRKDTMMEYAKKNLKRVPLDVQKEHYERIKTHAEGRGETVNGFIKRSIDSQMERDNGGTASEIAGKRPESTARAGVVSLPYETLEAAQRAAGRTGESVAVFVARAVAEQDKRDDNSIKMGINPA